MVTGCVTLSCQLRGMEQLALALDLPRRGPRLRPRYTVWCDGLIEDLGETRYVYGFWNRLFGCWRIDAETGRSREIVPCQAVLGARGAGTAAAATLEHPVFGADALLDVESRYRASAAFAGYFAEIPSRIRRLVAPMGRYQWIVLDLIWQSPRFARFAEDELYRHRGHYLYACLALGDLVNERRAERRAFATALMTRRRRDLLGEIVGRPVSAALLRALDRLPSTPCAPRTYQMLVEQFADPAKARVLCHLPTITPAHIRVLDKLPDEAVQGKCVDFLASLDTGPSVAAELARLFERLPEPLRGRATQGLARLDDEAGLARWITRRRRNAEAMTPFPEPPFAGSKRLVPLRSAGALRREARIMNNCLDGMVAGVLGGSVYFYRWSGKTRASVMLVRDGEGMWRFDSALGSGNTVLDRETRTRIMNDVREAARAAEVHR